MIKAINKKICCLPSRDTGISVEWSKNHNGVDWGWHKSATDNAIYPIQDGIVREVGYGGWNSKIGYFVTIEHQYDDQTHSFTGYIHLRDYPLVSVGQKVEAGKTVLGYMGGSPYENVKNKTGRMYKIHLHMYITPATTKGYSWSTMKELCFNPFETYTFCKLKGVKYELAEYDGHKFNNAPIYEDTLKQDSDEVIRLREEVSLATEENNMLKSKLEAIKSIL